MCKLFFNKKLYAFQHVLQTLNMDNSLSKWSNKYSKLKHNRATKYDMEIGIESMQE